MKFTFETPPPKMVASVSRAARTAAARRADVPRVRSEDRSAWSCVDKLKVTANNVAVPVRMIDRGGDREGQAARELVDATIKNEQDGRWVAFRADEAVPEGCADRDRDRCGHADRPRDRTSRRSAQTLHVPHVSAAARSSEAECGWGGECRAGMPFTIEFNNPLDDDKFDEAQLTVTPAISGAEDRAERHGDQRDGPDEGAHDVQGRSCRAACSTSSARRSAPTRR